MARGNPAERQKSRHIGFKAAVAAAREGGAKNPAAAVAAAAQHASAKAKRANPNLTKVGGVGKNKKAGAKY